MIIGVDPDYLASLLPPNPEWGKGGAMPLLPDIRDRSIFSMPEVQGVLPALPMPYDNSPNVQFIENQGAEGSCVGFSSATMASLINFLRDRGWDRFDGRRLWAEAGGNDNVGADSRRVLENMRGQGVPLLASGQRLQEIEGYFFAPQAPGAFRQAIAAAIAANYGVVIAVLLPQNFGWSSEGGATSLYHQVVACGYTGLSDDDWCIIVNSWGPGFGQNGRGRIRWSFFEADRNQNGLCYAFTVTPKGDVPPPPPPPPPPVDYGAAITARYTGPKNDHFAPGFVAAYSSGSLEIQSVTWDNIPPPPPPPPPPGELTVMATVTRPRNGVSTIYVWVTGAAYTGQLAEVQGTVGSVTLAPRNVIIGGAAIGWRVSGVQSGQIVTIDARTGTASGRGQRVVP